MKTNFKDFSIVKLFAIRVFFWWFKRTKLKEMDGLLTDQMLSVWSLLRLEMIDIVYQQVAVRPA